MKKTTDFEPLKNEDVINKIYLDEKFFKVNGHLTSLEKNCNEFQLQYNKQSVEEVLIQGAVKTTIQKLYNKGLFDNYACVYRVLEDCLFTTRRRVDLEKVNDVVQ